MKNSDNPTNSRRSSCEKPWGDNLMARFFQNIWLHTQRKDVSNTFRPRSPQRNRPNTKINVRSPNGDILWHCRSCFARGYFNSIPVHNLPKLTASCADRFIERKWLYTGKGKKQTIPCTNYYGRGPRWWHSANTPAQAESLAHTLEKAARGIGLYVNANETEYMCFYQNQTRDISTLKGSSLKLVDKFSYLGNSASSTEKDIITRLAKAWSAIDRLSVRWTSDLFDKVKRNFFPSSGDIHTPRWRHHMDPV